MTTGGHTHLILAGDARLTGEIRRALPSGVAAKLIDTIPAASHHKQDDVVAATLCAFIEREEQESQAVAARFVRAIRTHGRAVAGAAACLDALRQQRADTLLLAVGVLREPGWRCTGCGVIRIAHQEPAACPECGKKPVMAIDATNELVRLAGRQECTIEFVEHCDPLMALGGAGCLLRY